MDENNDPYVTPESQVDVPEKGHALRSRLRSPIGRFLVNVAVGILVIVFVAEAQQINRIMDTYSVERGTLMWLICVLTIVSSLAAVIFLLLTPWFWSWAVLIWSLVVPLIALLGFRMGLNPDFLVRWDVFLPWVLLPFTFYFEKPYGSARSGDGRQY